MTYNKEDAQMTKGLGILCMLALHLFCRKGSAVFGTPLLWINDTTPFVYTFGFFAEICVPIYSMAAGYAMYLMYEQKRDSFKHRSRRILNLLVNYWIILVLFSLISIVYTGGSEMPGSTGKFIKAVFLLDSYNGAWWYLHSYVFALCIPTAVLMYMVKKLNLVNGITLCLILEVIGYLIRRFDMINFQLDLFALSYIKTEIDNLLRILPSIWIGGFFCKYKLIEKVGVEYKKIIPNKFTRNMVTGSILCAMFVIVNILHKAVLMLPVAIVVFVLFNIWEKNIIFKKIFLVLGKHSTNIWLIHMFFYAYIFERWIEIFKYPVFMLLAMTWVCIAFSYVISFIHNAILKITLG